MYSIMSIVVLMSPIRMETQAEDEDQSCPCFSHEEVESMFLRAQQLAAEGGEVTCSAEDYSVERNAEVTVWDQDFELIAKAKVEWFDFDSGYCKYVDNTGSLDVERNIRWPHPAPEATAMACFNIISSVIAKSDTTAKCNTYP